MFAFKWPLIILFLPMPVLLFKYLINIRINKKNKIKKLNNYNNLENDTICTLNLVTNTRLVDSFSKVNIKDNINKKNKYINWLALTIWLFLVLALMRPQLVNKISTQENKGFDIMLGVDLSGSMKALDFSTRTQEITRLAATKYVVKKFVEKRDHDRVGLIVFADHAYSYVPLSYDKNAVATMLDSLTFGMAGEMTAVGDAIGLAVKNLSDKNSGSKIFILLTDGEDNSSRLPPIEAAKLAKQYGIKIYTIGIGSDGLVPVRDYYNYLIF